METRKEFCTSTSNMLKQLCNTKREFVFEFDWKKIGKKTQWKLTNNMAIFEQKQLFVRRKYES